MDDGFIKTMKQMSTTLEEFIKAVDGLPSTPNDLTNAFAQGSSAKEREMNKMLEEEVKILQQQIAELKSENQKLEEKVALNLKELKDAEIK
jgi:DNA-binding transcriptional MerR regulator